MKTHIPAKEKQGFTIIEVVLVLAIAGLIFLIVFLAVPALQRSQRDTQRRSDMGRFMGQIQNYQSNNQGNVPAPNSIDGFVNTYLTPEGSEDQFADPLKDANYTADGFTGAANAYPGDYGVIHYYRDGKCDPSATYGVSNADGGRIVAAQIKLEGGGYYCQDNR